jgi:hypothetical protein
MAKSIGISEELIVNKIYHIRGQKVMLDRDLAEMYEVETRILNQAVKRNIKRFPEDFMFQITSKELEEWKSQNVISNKEIMGLRKLPNVFTEQGVAILSSVLKSETAIEVNIRIIRAFTKMREFVISNKDVLLKLEKIEKHLLVHSQDIKSHDGEIETLFELVDEIRKESEQPKKLKRNPIGYKLPKPKKK